MDLEPPIHFSKQSNFFQVVINAHLTQPTGRRSNSLLTPSVFGSSLQPNCEFPRACKFVCSRQSPLKNGQSASPSELHPPVFGDKLLEKRVGYSSSEW